MRPEEFSQMLRNHPGSLASRSASSGAADVAKDRLRQAFEQHSQETQQRRERLQMERVTAAQRIWAEAGLEISSKDEGVDEDA